MTHRHESVPQPEPGGSPELPAGPPGIPTVAIQGEPGAFSHTAAEQLYGPKLELVPTRTFEELFEAVVAGRAQRALVPVENTLAGSVQGNLDRIVRHGLHVVAETRVRIRLSLVAPPGATLPGIRTAASHPVALQQCQAFFRQHPGIEPVAVYDTAGSIRDLMSGTAEYEAAIGSDLAAQIYGAEILKAEIEDNPENYTRFFAVSQEAEAGAGPMPKTSLAFVVAHVPGSLYEALGVFARKGVDLTKLESRPIPGRPWEYRFYADVRGDAEGSLAGCLQELRAFAAEVHVLGSYPEWPTSAPG
jgi:prephenate dehydratase